ncbi:MAG: glycosyltransferase family 1 protein [Candidatus Rickettsiella isopodorum]|nr:glycosyltransferase family 1 protein [Candidatus Rickettsiella isopodorum]MDD5342145.1 glycosyltransferase family 1 protein [Patescibacteria group bacterium]
MRIGIAARGLSELCGGVKQYIESLTKSLLQIDHENQYFIFYDSKTPQAKFDQDKEILLKTKNKLWYDYVKLPRALIKHKIDICIFPKNVVPFNIKCKSIVIIHDLLHIMDPKVYNRFDSFYMQLAIPFSVKKADIVVTVSENTKKDLLKITGINEKKIHVIHEAADEKYRVIQNHNEAKRQLLHKYHITSPFLLYVGSLSPRKNIPCLIKAFEILNKTNNVPRQLVLAGGKSWKEKEILRLIRISPQSKNINLTGFITDDDLPLIYNQAELFIYPSLYEGFGLPILEAMACGCPVVSSNSSSLPEVAGDAALYFDPTNEHELVNKLCAVAANDELKKNLITRGLVRAKQFKWEYVAQSIIKIYHEL